MKPGFDAFLIFNDLGVKDNNMGWIEKDEDIKSYVATFKVGFMVHHM